MSGRTCKSCGAHLYKRPDVGTVRRTDHAAWCRDPKCPAFNEAQHPTRFKPVPPVVTKVLEKPKKPPEPVPDVVSSVAGAMSPEELKKAIEALPGVHVVEDWREAESDFLKAARKQVNEATADVEKAHGKIFIGLALAIVCQETESFEVANKLIVEYGLEKLYGMKQRNS